jgi:hypothetical protein
VRQVPSQKQVKVKTTKRKKVKKQFGLRNMLARGSGTGIQNMSNTPPVTGEQVLPQQQQQVQIKKASVKAKRAPQPPVHRTEEEEVGDSDQDQDSEEQNQPSTSAHANSNPFQNY